MALVDFWSSSRDQLEDKLVQQIISFAGSGQLRDDHSTSHEFREFLSLIPSSRLRKYSDQCLQDSFTNSGFALQDIVNQKGRRLGFTVFDGQYRESSSTIGYYGLWKFQVEVHFSGRVDHQNRQKLGGENNTKLQQVPPKIITCFDEDEVKMIATWNPGEFIG